MNERILYKRNCDLCKKSIVNMYPPDSPLTVYCNSCWWSDNWDQRAYGRDYDPSKPFLQQLDELIRSTPQAALAVNYPTLVNSDYINHAATSKNCYLIFTADYCENVLYSSILLRNKDSMDCFGLGNSELCYWDVRCGGLYNTFFSEECVDCHDVYFSRYCRGCSNCFGCINLRNKNYHIFNQPYTKEEYQKKIKEFRLDSHRALEEIKKQVAALWNTRPYKFMDSGVRSVNVSGNYIYDSRNAHDMMIVGGVEDSRYCQIITLPTTKDCYDYTIWGNHAQRVYEALTVGEGADSVKFSHQCWPEVMDVQYCHWTMSSSHMFGCANVRKKEYYILNKQYSKEEFEKLREKIIQDMNEHPYTDSRGHVYRYGEFLPPGLSLHAYNESYAMDFFPLTKEKILKQGLAWRELPVPPQAPTLRGDAIPDSIFDTPDSITKEILECVACQKPFLIVPAELVLLRRFGFPIPRKCFNCRYLERLTRITPPKLWDRVCAKCKKAIRTSYAPDRPEIVYCEQCFNAEIV